MCGDHGGGGGICGGGYGRMGSLAGGGPWWEW